MCFSILSCILLVPDFTSNVHIKNSPTLKTLKNHKNHKIVELHMYTIYPWKTTSLELFRCNLFAAQPPLFLALMQQFSQQCNISVWWSLTNWRIYTGNAHSTVTNVPVGPSLPSHIVMHNIRKKPVPNNVLIIFVVFLWFSAHFVISINSENNRTPCCTSMISCHKKSGALQ